jgi:uncharacterized phage protein (TIGR02220 family)
MAKDPAFLFYPNDYLGGTMGMTFEEKGAYIELLCLQFNRGHMTSHMIGHMVGQLWDNIKDKFVIDEQGKYYNIRLDEEKEKRSNFTKSRHNNLLGKNQYTKKSNNNDGHMTSHMENENENENEFVNKDAKIDFDFLKLFNETASRQFKVLDEKTKRQIKARIKEGFTVADFETAIKNCSTDKYHIENPQYLTPEFITRSDKLQKFLNSTNNGTSTKTYTKTFSGKYNGAKF